MNLRVTENMRIILVLKLQLHVFDCEWDMPGQQDRILGYFRLLIDAFQAQIVESARGTAS